VLDRFGDELVFQLRPLGSLSTRFGGIDRRLLRELTRDR
jgi:hypothetical protein